MVGKGQGAAEYIILLGAVLLIGLIVISMLTSNAGSSGDVSDTESSVYWTGQSRPLSVLDGKFYAPTWPCYQSGAPVPPPGLMFVVKNNGKAAITVTSVHVNGAAPIKICSEPGNDAESVAVNPGEVRNIYINPWFPGNGYDFCGYFGEPKKKDRLDLAFIYDSEYLTGKVQNGTVKFVLDCTLPE